ncbi:MAG: hypothetical protein F4229_15480 [Gammaproteobacteria bacterium]|nr:hypothetical protein [Gammaproteobacteria bacterium]
MLGRASAPGGAGGVCRLDSGVFGAGTAEGAESQGQADGNCGAGRVSRHEVVDVEVHAGLLAGAGL